MGSESRITKPRSGKKKNVVPRQNADPPVNEYISEDCDKTNDNGEMTVLGGTKGNKHDIIDVSATGSNKVTPKARKRNRHNVSKAKSDAFAHIVCISSSVNGQDGTETESMRHGDLDGRARESQYREHNDTSDHIEEVDFVNDLCNLGEPQDRSGVIFCSRIPPFMNISKLRSYFSRYGKVGKIYAEPETLTDYKTRVKHGGNKKLKFVHGWIEFMDKSIAKKVALHLNGQPVGDKKRHNFWRDDLWNLKYLPRYKFRDVMEYLHKHRSERKEKLSYHLAQARKENYNYLEQLEAEKQHKSVEDRRRKQGADAFTYRIHTRPKKQKVKENQDTDKNVPLNLLGAIVS
ncbi:Pre-rRNA-processing protein esf2 [Babesia sp. Xinjiang]|uniref:Pre-rRNA-processing protein esf2 n=1 Tax=Babesia sp. Xinjiang TaxID=462227 RepID=UPI000A215522|nr:Pre-rRNA-processing protein esf2 [Babesia sp. Xinjiang]ORM39765.1 Pre-rRNA-processing protein esf2 [Babesia sp. Xinjiang]